MSYGSLEYAYAAPFAEGLRVDPTFRAWVLRQTKFAAFADKARLLDEEMQERRGKGSATWWRSHYTHKCQCQGCSGQETDLLAIFEASLGFRFALHFEVKQPKDRFSNRKDQANNYALRAECWKIAAPAAIIPHSDAITILLCSKLKLVEFAPHILKFSNVLTFEDIAVNFPNFARAG